MAPDRTPKRSSSSSLSPLFSSPHSDLVLISSEDHRFPVLKLILLSSSTVLSDLLSIPQDPNSPVKAEMKVEESTATLDFFLRFLHRGPNPRNLSFDQLRELFNVCRKYDVESLHPALSSALYAHVSAQPMDVWAILTIHDQPVLAKECFKLMDKKPVSSIPGDPRDVFSPSCISADLLPLLPPGTLKRLLMAYDVVVRRINSWETVAASGYFDHL